MFQSPLSGNFTTTLPYIIGVIDYFDRFRISQISNFIIIIEILCGETSVENPQYRC